MEKTETVFIFEEQSIKMIVIGNETEATGTMICPKDSSKEFMDRLIEFVIKNARYYANQFVTS